MSLIFVKQPEPGRVKTRLGQSIGFDRSANLYADLARRVWDQLRQYSECEHWVVFEPAAALESIRTWLPGADRYLVQAEGDLGNRLESAFAAAHDGRQRAVTAVGSDVPDLRAEDLRMAFDALRTHDAVIGPAHDGGYWLIGLARPLPELFRGIAWSTSAVTGETVRVLEGQARSYRLLRVLRDIDELADLRHFPDLMPGSETS